MQPALADAVRVEEHDPAKLDQIVGISDRPAIFRGLVADWPVVDKARTSHSDVAAYLTQMHKGAPVRAFVGQPGIGGRFFYRDTFDGFNFGIGETTLPQLLKTLLALAESGDDQSIYMGSTATSEILPKFASENPLEPVEKLGGEPRIWIGNESRIAPHFDESDNVACVVGGKRTFTLFPPDQVQNLYVGPLDTTPAGQPTSLVDLADPDFERFPRFREAAKHAQVAELERGDALYIPGLWWHGVQSRGPLNILVNYWWLDQPADAGSPLVALAHGVLSVGNLPERKRKAWRHLFDYYVFRLHGDPAEHIPERARGALGRSSPQLRAMIRSFLVGKLQGR